MAALNGRHLMSLAVYFNRADSLVRASLNPNRGSGSSTGSDKDARCDTTGSSTGRDRDSSSRDSTGSRCDSSGYSRNDTGARGDTNSHGICCSRSRC